MYSLVLAMGTPQGPGVNPYVQLIPIALVFAIFYFIILLPTKRRQKKLQEFLDALKVGDRIVTNGGIYGSVTKVDGTTVQLQMYKDEIVGTELPAAVELEVTSTEPGIQGDRVSGARKPAVLETGKTVQVPLFVETGDKIRVDTRTGEYMTRV